MNEEEHGLRLMHEENDKIVVGWAMVFTAPCPCPLFPTLTMFFFVPPSAFRVHRSGFSDQ
jgi:hypothetical protein